jgi:hypothetical protein
MRGFGFLGRSSPSSHPHSIQIVDKIVYEIESVNVVGKFVGEIGYAMIHPALATHFESMVKRQ